MPLTIQSRRQNIEKVREKNPGATIIDVTSKAPEPWVKFSPFYPHGEIPIPEWPGHVSESVEGLWQALKVFEGEDIDFDKCKITSMKNIKRGMKRGRGNVLGHRLGDSTMLGYYEARLRIYLPAYQWVLQHKLTEEMAELRRLSEGQDIVLLDFETNSVISDLGRPLSHASLIIQRISRPEIEL